MESRNVHARRIRTCISEQQFELAILLKAHTHCLYPYECAVPDSWWAWMLKRSISARVALSLCSMHWHFPCTCACLHLFDLTLSLLARLRLSASETRKGKDHHCFSSRPACHTPQSQSEQLLDFKSGHCVWPPAQSVVGVLISNSNPWMDDNL